MTQEEIKKKIDENYEKMNECFFNDTFVLNKEMERLEKENEELRKLCHHEFKDGICIYCQQVEEPKE